MDAVWLRPHRQCVVALAARLPLLGEDVTSSGLGGAILHVPMGSATDNDGDDGVWHPLADCIPTWPAVLVPLTAGPALPPAPAALSMRLLCEPARAPVPVSLPRRSA